MNEFEPALSDAQPLEADTFVAPPADGLAPGFHPAAPKPTLRRLFFGDDGLRAGWSLLLFVLLLVGLSFAVNGTIRHFHLLPKPVKHPAGEAIEMKPRMSLITDALGFGMAALAALLTSLVERRPFSRYGFAPRRVLSDFGIGLVWGLVMLSALVGALALTHTLVFDGLLLHGATAFAYAAKWALVFLFVGLFEEFLTRGYIQYTLARGFAGLTRALSPGNRHAHAIGFWAAAFLFSVCFFMLAHLGNPGETAPGILAVGLAGAVFAFSLYRTGALWWAIGVHTSWDWAQSFFYGVRDSGTLAQGHLLASHPMGPTLISGGTVGPEGSLLVIPTLLLLAVIIHYTLPRRSYPLTHDQTPPPTESHAVELLPDQMA